MYASHGRVEEVADTVPSVFSAELCPKGYFAHGLWSGMGSWLCIGLWFGVVNGIASP